MVRLFVELCVRSRLVALMFCSALVVAGGWAMVYYVRTLIDYGDVPVRISCADAPHAPRWVTLDANLDCDRAKVYYRSNRVWRTYAPVVCQPGEPSIEVGMNGECKSGFYAYMGNFEFDRRENVWMLCTWGGPTNSRLGVLAGAMFVAAGIGLYGVMDKERRKRGVPRGRWLP